MSFEKKIRETFPPEILQIINEFAAEKKKMDNVIGMIDPVIMALMKKDQRLKKILAQLHEDPEGTVCWECEMFIPSMILNHCLHQT